MIQCLDVSLHKYLKSKLCDTADDDDAVSLCRFNFYDSAFAYFERFFSSKLDVYIFLDAIKLISSCKNMA